LITPKNLIKHELIGLDASVFNSTNKFYIGLNGKILNETKSMLFIKTKKGLRKVPKKNSVFIFMLPNGKKVKVDGKRICYRPEDRIKLKVKKW